MPIYDYACDQCNHRFEARQSFADDPLTSCPECQGHIRRVIHPSGIIFKGSGWYVTDSRKSESETPTTTSNGSSEGDSATSDKAKSTSSESTSSDSKSKSKAAADD